VRRLNQYTRRNGTSTRLEHLLRFPG